VPAMCPLLPGAPAVALTLHIALSSSGVERPLRHDDSWDENAADEMKEANDNAIRKARVNALFATTKMAASLPASGGDSPRGLRRSPAHRARGRATVCGSAARLSNSEHIYCKGAEIGPRSTAAGGVHGMCRVSSGTRWART
jgi:hypothetical protein